MPPHKEPPDEGPTLKFSDRFPATRTELQPVNINPAKSGDVLKQTIRGKYFRNKTVLKYSRTVSCLRNNILHSSKPTAKDQQPLYREIPDTTTPAKGQPSLYRKHQGTISPVKDQLSFHQKIPDINLQTNDKSPNYRKTLGTPATATTSMPTILQKLLSSTSTYKAPKFIFQAHEDAAAFNFDLLQSSNFDLDSLLNPPNHRSVTAYGSEFKPVEDLEQLLRYHPRWMDLKYYLQHGFEFKVHPIPEQERKEDLAAIIKRGNHQSAKAKRYLLSDALKKEINKAWALILPIDAWKVLPDLEVAPMGVASRLGIAATGEYIEKDRITHDLSWRGHSSHESINSRTEECSLHPVMFGYCMSRIIHYIVNLRQRHPKKIIWIRKEDFKSAYRRLHLSAKIATKVGVKLDIKGTEYLLLTLRHPFGGKAGPSHFCLLSNIVVDTINDLLLCKEWDDKTVTSNFIKHIPEAEACKESAPFKEARKLIVDIPAEDEGKCDGYIDDLITVVVDIGRNQERSKAAPCTIIHAIAHLTQNELFVERDDQIAIDKCKAEGAPSEIKICLGWEIDTRRLLMKLPQHKYIAWDTE